MTMLAQATIIMVLGMAVTSAFIGLVIAGVNLSARILRRLEGPSPEACVPPPPTPPSISMDGDGGIVAAIAAALLLKPKD